jgi:hypothetical protein
MQANGTLPFLSGATRAGSGSSMGTVVVASAIGVAMAALQWA